MAVYTHIDQLPEFKNAVITIGSFDGVHIGHRLILSKVVKAAKEMDGESILITFDPHPRKIIHPEQPLGILSSLNQKIELITEAGIDHIIIVPFTRDFSNMSADEYVHDFLLKKINPAKIIIGYDHRFGHDRSGNIDTLKSLLPSHVKLEEIPAKLIEDAAISSTKIRNALLSGNIHVVSEMLGRPYRFDATVIHGKKIGRTIGYPTANLQPLSIDTLIPGIGIYAVLVTIKDKVYKGMMSIGFNPTISDEQKLSAEVNILDFNEDIYGVNLTVTFIAYIRSELKFSGLEALKEQLAADEISTRALLA